jgi:hypoxanthine phosphoribosyltransferase
MQQLHKITPLISAEKISWRISEMAQEIASQMPPDLMIVGLLRGSFVFAADLLRALHAAGAKNNIRPQVDFMTLLSYGAGTTSSGSIQVARDIADPVQGRDVLIIDDILESGRTLTFAHQRIKDGGARSVKIAVLLEKPGKRKVDINADYVGFIIPDKFVVGYGLDYANYYRELPFIGSIEQ